MPRPCRRCHGSGEEHFSPEPYRVIPDPQRVADYPCSRCYGTGDEPSDERLDHIHAIAQEWEKAA
jgi:DnaJ-class molecular chaperone